VPWGRQLWKTTDNAVALEPVFFKEAVGVVDVAMDPARPDTICAASYQRRRQAYGFHGGGPGSGLHKSTDGGRTCC